MKNENGRNENPVIDRHDALAPVQNELGGAVRGVRRRSAPAVARAPSRRRRGRRFGGRNQALAATLGSIVRSNASRPRSAGSRSGHGRRAFGRRLTRWILAVDAKVAPGRA